MSINHGRIRQVGWGAALAVLALLFLFSNQLLGFTVDWLWFGEVGQRRVFWTILATRAQLALLFGVSFFLMTFLNVWLARRSSPPFTPHYADFPIRVRVGRLAQAGLSLLLLGGSLVAGLFAGLEAAGHWDEFLRFLHPVAFGRSDPVFGRDLGFYVFQYPFWSYLYQWVFVAVLLVAVATALVYYFDRAVELLQGYAHVAPSVRIHLSILLGILALVKAWGYRLDAYGLLFTPNGSFWGAGYTDLHARLLALNLLTGLVVIAAIGFFINAYLRLLWLPAAALGLMIVASILIGGVYPGIVQRFTVQPNELALERPYIKRHLEMTRAAYGLDRITTSAFGATTPLTPQSVQSNEGTVQNIRLWDYRPLRDTYRQLQRLKPYYDFPDIDIDRYSIGGHSRQVMLAAREIEQDGLPLQARRWVNEWLEYTHGYGFVMNPVNEVTSNGAPVFWGREAPQKSPPGLPVTQPQIYFGQATDIPAIAPSLTPEFDHPEGSESVRTRYTGTGGVPIGGTLRRMLFATYFSETNILISKQIAPDSRILFNRRVDERAARIAPFLSFDADPYLVVADGRLFWMQDAYTSTAYYPYSTPARGDARELKRWTINALEMDDGDFNYLRNSVKIVTDAYNGKIQFYVADLADPIVRSYQAAFPSLFQPLARMPSSLRAHVRYPEGLFTVQAGLYANYHVTDPASLFVQSDRWQFPSERVSPDVTPTLTPAQEMPPGFPQGTGRAGRPMEPFYVSMRLPGERDVEFVLMLPFEIAKPPSMPAWLCARCDGEKYGRLRALTFPQGVDGPTQAESFIDQDQVISPALTLWGQHGSRVIRGNLLVLPLGQSILYLEPVFLVAESETNRVPRLTRVILVNAERAVMAPTLGEALSELIRAVSPGSPELAVGTTGNAQTGSPPAASAAAQPVGPTGSVAALVKQANQAFQAATEAQKRGDWAGYGTQLTRLQLTLRELNRRTGALK